MKYLLSQSMSVEPIEKSVELLLIIIPNVCKEAYILESNLKSVNNSLSALSVSNHFLPFYDCMYNMYGLASSAKAIIDFLMAREATTSGFAAASMTTTTKMQFGELLI